MTVMHVEADRVSLADRLKTATAERFGTSTYTRMS